MNQMVKNKNNNNNNNSSNSLEFGRWLQTKTDDTAVAHLVKRPERGPWGELQVVWLPVAVMVVGKNKIHVISGAIHGQKRDF